MVTGYPPIPLRKNYAKKCIFGPKSFIFSPFQTICGKNFWRFSAIGGMGVPPNSAKLCDKKIFRQGVTGEGGPL